VQEHEGAEVRARRKRRSREQIAELVWEFKASGLRQAQVWRESRDRAECLATESDTPASVALPLRNLRYRLAKLRVSETAQALESVRCMSDIYVQYEYKDAVSGAVQRIIVMVPRAKIEAYRGVKKRPCSDADIARELSEQPALSSFPEGPWLSPVTYSDALPAELQERAPAFEENGMTFWEA
jgi:hypothetical protein